MSKVNDENKIRVPQYLSPDVLAEIEKVYSEDNCDSRSEFIEKAVVHYLGYLSSEKHIDYLCQTLLTVIEAKMSVIADSMSSILFKMAVQVLAQMYLTGDMVGADKRKIERAIEIATEEVKKVNGIIDFKTVINRSRKDEIPW